MAEPTIPSLSPNPNPSPAPSPKVYQIGGVPVEFPYKPYGTQLAFMGRVIATLDRARRQGHCHALLESPTGTGKSLSLLCSTIAWQQHQLRRPLTGPSTSSPHDPLVNGGGFIPEPDPSGNLEQSPPVSSSRAQKKKMVPTIYYASRTHSQIAQVIRELRKTSYRVPMAVLASRKHYCTNSHVCDTNNVDEECKLLLKDSNAGCSQFKNAHKVKSHPSLQKGGYNEVHDIEDLVKVGRTVKGCSYFAAQSLAEEAQLVFCPYSYVMSPIVRRAMNIDIKGSILILDEAHNIEDIARDAGSVDVEEDVLHLLQTELGQLCMGDTVAMIYQPLYDMVQGIISWINDRKNFLQKHEFEHYSSYWTGDKAISELQLAGITQQCFPVLQECATKAIKAASDVESDEVHLSGISTITLDGLFSSLNYFFSGNGNHALDYQLALQRYVKRDSGSAASGWTCLVSLWCLNPATVFREIADLSLSVILTSGTLSPMGSFASELGVQFEACLEAPHVIDVESQLWAAVISSGPGNHQLNASYKTADAYGFQDALGASLEEICKIVPGGALVFFPSYKLLEKLRNRWCQTGQWNRLNAQKSVFVEPRGSADDFDSVLKGYYDSIHGKHRTDQKFKRKKKLFQHPNTKESEQALTKGAAFLAVCRGKVSEGIDFSDESARVVVIVGIPFPNINDVQVRLKKRYNDMYKSSKNLLSGSEWYCHQAFRALNQAAGRCIRHQRDYGAIILLDERFKEERNLTYISRWLRKSIKQYDSFDKSLEGLQTFFENAEKQFGQKQRATLQDECPVSDVKGENFSASNGDLVNKVAPVKTNQRKSNRKEKRVLPKSLSATAKHDHLVKEGSKSAKKFVDDFCWQKTDCNIKTETAGMIENEKPFNEVRDFVTLENSSLMHSRCIETFSTPSYKKGFDQSMVAEDSTTEHQTTWPRDTCKNENSYSDVTETCSQTMGRPSFLLFPNKILSESLPANASMQETTPEREACEEAHGTEADLNSVNSHSQKRRKLIDSQLSSCTKMVHLSTHDDESCCLAGSISSISRYANERTGSPHYADNSSRSKLQKPLQTIFTKIHPDALCLSSDQTTKKMLNICCLICKNALGLDNNKYLVPCSLAATSKAFVSYILENGPTSTCFSQGLVQHHGRNIHIVITDVSSINQRIFERCARGAQQHDTWSEEDGCVFRILFCPFCLVSRLTCLGLQIMAVDTTNIHLLNKVMFYADFLDIKEEESRREDLLPGPMITVSEDSGQTQIEKFAYIPPRQNFGSFNTTKSKLKLPKKEQVHPGNQEAVYTSG
ncbi:hypothetical protein J5N97_023678 [Dioscorea zingiberensis]|uniref:DNA 5'-3' helicase FANCJ n=1 Tax=Dioscorea zingiberensis TaxID=325984 RepID=A0A9D5C4Z8_9LILI|nr:hypothetical protein J5N97_023678 [Dioscorea zingiberensis]